MPDNNELARLLAAQAARSAREGKSMFSNPVTNYVTGMKVGGGLPGLMASKAASSQAQPKPKAKAKTRPDAAPVDENQPLWDLLDRRVAWTKLAGAQVNNDAGIVGADALQPQVADRYRQILQDRGMGSLVGVNLQGLSDEERAIMARGLRPEYFDQLQKVREQAASEVQAEQNQQLLAQR